MFSIFDFVSNRKLFTSITQEGCEGADRKSRIAGLLWSGNSRRTILTSVGQFFFFSFVRSFVPFLRFFFPAVLVSPPRCGVTSNRVFDAPPQPLLQQVYGQLFIRLTTWVPAVSAIIYFPRYRTPTYNLIFPSILFFSFISCTLGWLKKKNRIFSKPLSK